MQFSGVNKLTLLDYPGRTACILFTPGCNFRCGYCHNPEFVLPEMLGQIRESFIPEEAIVSFLRERRGKLEGVVITGGEPTIQPDLGRFIREVKKMGFLIKLDTNGNKPEVLKQLVEEGLIDFVALDVKTSLARYPDLVGGLARPEKIAESIAYLKGNPVEYEFRTTLVKEKHSREVLEEMKDLVRGAKRLFLQTFRPGIVLDPQFHQYRPFSPEETENIRTFFSEAVESVVIRTE